MFYYLKIYLFAPFRDEEIKKIFAFRKFLRSAQSHAVKHICPLRGLLSKLIIILIPPTGLPYIFYLPNITSKTFISLGDIPGIRLA